MALGGAGIAGLAGAGGLAGATALGAAAHHRNEDVHGRQGNFGHTHPGARGQADMYCDDIRCHQLSPCRDHPIGGSYSESWGNRAGYDPRDRNMDGHVSMTERMQGAPGVYGHDARDTNFDGHVSTGERLNAIGHQDRLYEGRTGVSEGNVALTLAEEQLRVGKREVGAGEVGIRKRVETERVQEQIPLRREEVIVERRPATHLDGGAHFTEADAHIRVPLFKEEAVVEKLVVPKEEVIVRKKEVIDHETVGADLRSEYAEVDRRVDMHADRLAATHLSGAAYDARDRNGDGHVSMGERLMGAPAGFDARDRNGDGHVSMGERMMGAPGSAGFDARDRNGDGHVSMGERLRGPAPIAGGFDPRDRNHDGRVSMGEKLTQQPGIAGDYRDTNRDGHVSVGEKLKSANPAPAAYDNRDLNGDGKVSMGERVADKALNRRK